MNNWYRPIQNEQLNTHITKISPNYQPVSPNLSNLPNSTYSHSLILAAYTLTPYICTLTALYLLKIAPLFPILAIANYQISHESKLHRQLFIYLLLRADQSQSRIYLPAHSQSILSDMPFWYLLVVFLVFIHVLNAQKALTFVPNSL